MIDTEPHCLKIEAAPGNRLARVYDALRDLGLDLCSQCSVWKGLERINIVADPYLRHGGEFARAVCITCAASLPPGEAESGEGPGANATSAAGGGTPTAGDTITALRSAIALVAQPDYPTAAGSR